MYNNFGAWSGQEIFWDTVSRTCFGLKAARKGRSTNFEKSYFVCGLGANLGQCPNFFVRKSALEPKPHSALIILSVGLGWARENFGTVSRSCFLIESGWLGREKAEVLKGHIWCVGLGANFGQCPYFF